MSEVVPKGFSWSATRHNLFEDCPRAYFFHYYLAMGKVRGGDRERMAEAKRLRRLTTLPMWVGSVVHDAIEALIKGIRAGQAADGDAARESLLARMRRDYVDSRDDIARKTRDYYNRTRFHEHEYEKTPEPEVWKQAADDAVGMLETWLGMEYAEMLGRIGPSGILGVEELESWPFQDVPVWVKIDLAYRDEEGTVHIVDWKTGKKLTPDNPIQMTGYAVYANRTWDTPLDKLAVREVFLRLPDPEKWTTIDEETVVGAQETMLESIRSMLGALDDPRQDVAAEDDFPTAPSMGKCSRCFFQKVCPDGAEML